MEEELLLLFFFFSNLGLVVIESVCLLLGCINLHLKGVFLYEKCLPTCLIFCANVCQMIVCSNYVRKCESAKSIQVHYTQ